MGDQAERASPEKSTKDEPTTDEGLTTTESILEPDVTSTNHDDKLGLEGVDLDELEQDLEELSCVTLSENAMLTRLVLCTTDL